MWGSGIPFDTTSESAVLSELVPFLESHELTGLKGSQLMVSAFGKDSEADRVYVQLRQVETLNVPVWNDVSRKMHTTAPVWRRGVEGRFHQSKLTMLGVDVHSMSDEGIESLREGRGIEALGKNPNGIPRFFHWGPSGSLLFKTLRLNTLKVWTSGWFGKYAGKLKRWVNGLPLWMLRLGFGMCTTKFVFGWHTACRA